MVEYECPGRGEISALELNVVVDDSEYRGAEGVETEESKVDEDFDEGA